MEYGAGVQVDGWVWLPLSPPDIALTNC